MSLVQILMDRLSGRSGTSRRQPACEACLMGARSQREETTAGKS